MQKRALVPPVTVPTLYVWGDADATVGRAAAEGTARFVEADYRFEVISEAGHFLTDVASARVTELLLAHLARKPRESATSSQSLASNNGMHGRQRASKCPE